jgi:hypothetical protein
MLVRIFNAHYYFTKQYYTLTNKDMKQFWQGLYVLDTIQI